MARPHTTHKKRQKELARMEKQREKAAKRLERKLGIKPPDADEDAPLDEFGLPIEQGEPSESTESPTGSPVETGSRVE